ncbi:MAG: TRAP transporter small permease [Burkholderiaceae bacterium]
MAAPAPIAVGVRAPGQVSPLRALILNLDRAMTGASLAIGSLLLVVVSCLGLWQVAARFLLQQPSTWTEEFMRRLLIWMVVLGVVVAFRQGALVSVDLMLRMSAGRWQTFVRWVITVANLLFLGVIVWQGADLVHRVRFQTFASADISMAWAYAALPVGGVLAMLAVVANHLDPRSEELASAQ